MLFFLFTDIFCIFKGYETYQIMLYVLSFLAVIVFVALYFVKAGYGMFRTRSWGWSVPNKIGWVLMEAPSFVAMGLWAAGCICGAVHAALLSAFVCFSVADEREEPDATGYHGDGNTFQYNQCDLVGSQLFQLCVVGKVRTGHILDKSFTLGRSRDIFHRNDH